VAAIFPVSIAIAEQPDGAAPKVAHDARASMVPEPGDLALFAAGVVGLIIGRRGSRSKRRDDD